MNDREEKPPARRATEGTVKRQVSDHRIQTSPRQALRILFGTMGTLMVEIRRVHRQRKEKR